MGVEIGTVRTVAGCGADKAQALKVLEEAAEVYSAWERYRADPSGGSHDGLLCELADLVISACGMASALGVGDLSPWLADRTVSNLVRGRVMR